MWKIATGFVFWVAAGTVSAAAPASPAVCADCTRAVVVADAKGVAPAVQVPAATPAPALAPAEDARGAAGLPEGYALMLAGVVALIFMAGRRRRD
jgi:hypothetical protein